MFDANCLKLMFVAGSQDFYHIKGGKNDRINALLETLELALQSQITAFQFRQKGDLALQDPIEIKRLALECQKLCKKYGTPFIVNDEARLALELKADGVHVGQEDMAIEEVVTLCQKRLFIGLSVNTLEQALKARHLDGVAYLGVGPIFPTPSKKDAKEVVGVNLLKKIHDSGVEKPLIAIGGITTDNASKLQKFSGIAVISAITQARDKALAIEKLLNNA
ncbi:thiamine phosphate synthase [Helicobacter pylori]|uniref:thiamine phosphate synthase n=1 Tax=Helicobacter pylori TaxID=210 RepID=UPI0009A3A916|nr:thiamine phosphate synthase [Helicobacter pylori]MBH0250006.1 thiamine phosphate synthase [Helicobacter pylori]NHA20769.1 thiamine phosphate synthase [Helicobacter pylori]OPG51869.1 thiamine-phosphate diphosphorylase [Helicobacter pylori]WRC41133.1 thiamine phosphate synthase [Helicobacter pylori]WRC55305.1 thiamine phosphate synthase [Helicobacter pylori]